MDVKKEIEKLIDKYNKLGLKLKLDVSGDPKENNELSSNLVFYTILDGKDPIYTITDEQCTDDYLRTQLKKCEDELQRYVRLSGVASE